MDRLLTVVIPTYRRPEYLMDCLSAVLPSALKLNIDVIVCDNCSGDDTEKAVNEFTVKYENLQYVKLGHTVSLDENQLMFRHLVTTKYCFMIADDDSITEDCLQHILDELECDGDLDFILLNAFHYSEDLTLPQHINIEIDRNLFLADGRILMRDYFFKMHFSTLVFNMPLLSGIDETPYLGTYHAYCGIVYESLARHFLNCGKNKILIISKPLVLIRDGVKTYSHEKLKVEFVILTSFFEKVSDFYRTETSLKMEEHLTKLSSFYLLFALRVSRVLSIGEVRNLWLYLNPVRRFKLVVASLMPVKILEIVVALKNAFGKNKLTF